ncbi:MAG: hypothetical protein WC484_06535 [Candidatus Omnitrophota bacterium]|jgi:hypothetical protein
MSRQIICDICEIDMGEIRDASLRHGMRVLCNVCWAKLVTPKTDAMEDMPEFLKDLFGGVRAKENPR